MLRWVFIVLFFVHSLYAIGDNEILKVADSLMKTSKKSDKFRAYNHYKNVYLKAMMSEDDKLRKKALKGIVKSGKNLHIDISRYKKELLDLKSTKIKKSKKIKKNQKITLKALHKLKSINIVDDKLILKFDKKLKSNQVKYFTLHSSKKYKYVFDIHTAMITKSKILRKKGIDRIKFAQYNSNIIRLVIQNTKKMDIKFKKTSNELVISLMKESKKNKSKKVIVKKEIVKTKIPQRVDRNKIIVIDAGHGGKDPGAIGYKRYREKVVVLKIAKNLKNILKSRGYKVYMTRDSDKFIKLSNRTKFANNKEADIFISIHANSIGKKSSKKVSGVECYFLSPSRSKRAEKVAAKENLADMSLMNKYGKKSFLNVLNHHKIIASNKLAIDLQRGILGSLNKSYKNVRDSGVREGPFWVLVGTQMPSVLVEVGFISNPAEAKRLVSANYRKKFALGMANGIERYFINN